jgi:APA family basic amino acid/polyamine antiporter
LYENARFKFQPALMRFWGYAGVVSALVVIALGLGADVRPYLVLLGWAAIGAIYYVLWTRAKPNS